MDITGDGQKNRLDSVIKYIYENFTIDLSVQDVAAQANLSVSAFCHFFKKHTHKRLNEFVNELRIGYASKLLIETHNHVSDIAYQAGYNSISNFNKRFKEINMVSPSEYRK